MATNFKLKRSSVANKRPGLTNLELGELALNTYDGYLFSERDGLGITTITNLTPWFENYGAASIVYNNSVGIGTTDPIHKLDLRGSLGGIDNIFAPHVGVTKTFTVKVVTKTAKHRYNGSGSSLGYTVDGEQSPLITLTPGRTYRFDQADNSNSSHQIRFYLEADKTTLYSSGVTYNGTAGQAGSYTQIVVGDETPVVLHYQCVNHAYMGNAAQNNSNVVNTNYAAILRGGLNVSGAETILSSATVSDLTNTRVVYAGTSGSLENSANFTFNNNTLSVLNLDVDGLASFDDIVVSAASTFTGAVDVNGDIDVDGHTELDNVNISGVTTFVGNIDANGDIDVDGHTELDNVNIAGVTTFAGSIDANGDLDVDGETELDNLNVAGVSTYAGALDINSDIDVDGHTELDNLNVAGVSTFVGQINAGAIAAASATFTGNVSIAGTLTYQDVTNVDALGIGTFRAGVNVSGGQLDVGSNIKLGNAGVITATTFKGNGDFVELDVDGHTNLDNVSIVGVTTFNGLSSNDVIRVRSADSNGNSVVNILSEGTTGNSRILFSDTAATSGDGWISYSHNNRALTFATAGTSNERLRIQSDGDVSFGDETTGRAQIKHVSGDQADRNNGGYPQYAFVGNEGTGMRRVSSNVLAFDSSGAERLRIGSSGQIGLGGANYGTSGQVLTSQGSGSAVQWTAITGTTINNNANNRIITGSGTANTLEGESSLTYDGNSLTLENSSGSITAIRNGGGATMTLHGNPNSGNTAATNNHDMGNIAFKTADGTDRNNVCAYITGRAVGTFTNSSHPTQLEFWTTTDSSTTVTKRAVFTKSGQFIPAADNTYDLGDSSNRWRNLYTTDLQLSNKGKTNEVDGTWGDWTLQEGEDKIFMINNRTGKKYSLKMEEE